MPDNRLSNMFNKGTRTEATHSHTEAPGDNHALQIEPETTLGPVSVIRLSDTEYRGHFAVTVVNDALISFRALKPGTKRYSDGRNLKIKGGYCFSTSVVNIREMY
jgi:hypothetical protein